MVIMKTLYLLFALAVMYFGWSLSSWEVSVDYGDESDRDRCHPWSCSRWKVYPGKPFTVAVGFRYFFRKSCSKVTVRAKRNAWIRLSNCTPVVRLVFIGELSSRRSGCGERSSLACPPWPSRIVMAFTLLRTGKYPGAPVRR